MRTYARLAIAAVLVAASLAALVGSASAGRLSSSSQNFRVAWSSLELIGLFGVTVRCGVTLEGSFQNRSIVKTPGGTIGSVTSVAVRHPCTNGEAFAFNGVERLGATTLANSLPWTLTYVSFAGTLPNITRVTLGLSGARFRVRDPVFGSLCVYTTGGTRGAATGTATRRLENGVIDNLVAAGSITSDTSGCASGSFGSRAEDGVVSVQGAATKITVTLI